MNEQDRDIYAVGQTGIYEKRATATPTLSVLEPVESKRRSWFRPGAIMLGVLLGGFAVLAVQNGWIA